MIPEVTRPGSASETEQESSGLSTMARISAASGVGGRVVTSNTGGILKNNKSGGKGGRDPLKLQVIRKIRGMSYEKVLLFRSTIM